MQIFIMRKSIYVALSDQKSRSSLNWFFSYLHISYKSGRFYCINQA